MDKTTLIVRDLDGKNDLKIFIDWDKRKEETVLRAKMGETQALLSGDDLWKVAFVLATEEQQVDMLPINSQATRHFSKLVKIKATKKIKAGEEIVAKVNFSITDEHLKKIFGKVEKHSSGIVIQAPQETTGRIIK